MFVNAVTPPRPLSEPAAEPVVVALPVQGLGRQLRERREQQQLSLSHVARQLGIPEKGLAALESQQFHHLPGGGTTVSWLRRYSVFLGLDARQMIQAYRTQFPEESVTFRTDLIHPPYRRPRRRLMAMLAGLVVVMALAAGLTFVLLQEPAPQTPPVAAGMSVPPVPESLPSPEAVTDFPSLAGTAKPETGAMAPAPEPMTGTQPAEPGIPMPPAPAAIKISNLVYLQASGPVNVVVQDGQGRTLFSGLMQAGQKVAITPPQGGGLRLQADVPENVQMVVGP